MSLLNLKAPYCCEFYGPSDLFITLTYNPKMVGNTCCACIYSKTEPNARFYKSSFETEVDILVKKKGTPCDLNLSSHLGLFTSNLDYHYMEKNI